MKTKRLNRGNNSPIRKNNDGTWSHLYSQIKWTERRGAEMDFRFTVESGPATGWQCRIGQADCKQNCGNYGCGN